MHALDRPGMVLVKEDLPLDIDMRQYAQDQWDEAQRGIRTT
jgi:hypothetical protein